LLLIGVVAVAGAHVARSTFVARRRLVP